MAKTPTQEKLEAQRQRDIRDVVLDSLRWYRGRRNIVILVCADLDISDATLYRWCDELGIDIDDYRRPAVEAEKAAQEARERVLGETEERV